MDGSCGVGLGGAAGPGRDRLICGRQPAEGDDGATCTGAEIGLPTGGES